MSATRHTDHGGCDWCGSGWCRWANAMTGDVALRERALAEGAGPLAPPSPPPFPRDPRSGKLSVEEEVARAIAASD